MQKRSRGPLERGKDQRAYNLTWANLRRCRGPTEQVDVAKQYKGKSDLGAVHVWREDMPECIKAVLKEYSDIFP